MKKLILLSFALFFFFGAQAQEKTVEELKAEKAVKSAELAKLQGEVAALDAKIKTFPGWKYGGLGTIGFNLSQFNNWYGAANPNARTSTIGLTASAFANLDQAKYFWRNSGGLVFTRTRLIPDSDIDDLLPENERADFETTADAINVTSLFGYKLTDKFAVSALGEYRSTLGNFNDPGYLDLGVGGTWTPFTDLVVVIHPLNYNFVFADDDVSFQSSLGAKIVVDYSRSLPRGIAWKSNFTAFLSYEDASNLSNWTWVNGFSFTVWKGIGVGFDFGLRQNKQEVLSVIRAGEEAVSGAATSTFDSDFDNDLQTYWLLGLTYAF